MTSATPAQNKVFAGRLNTVQLLRAVAVLLVVHCHVMDMLLTNKLDSVSFQQIFFHFYNFGSVGVDIFFVISGFIITVISRSYAQENKALIFFIKRVIRVVPVYWVVSFIVALRFFIRGAPFPATAYIKTVLFIPFFDVSIFDGPVLFQGWTLSYELYFYAIVAIFAAISKSRYVFFSIVFFGLCIIAGLSGGNHGALITFLCNGIMIEFVAGALIGVLFLSAVRIKPFVLNGFLLLGCGGLMTSLLIGHGKIEDGNYTTNGSLSLLRAAAWGIPCALMVMGLVLKEKNKTINISKFWMLTGNASYSIYLIHFFILGYVYGYWIRWDILNKIQPDLLILITLVIVIIAGCLFYKIVEQPLLKFLKRRLGLSDKV